MEKATTQYVANELRSIGSALSSQDLLRLAEILDPSWYPYGTILKANEGNERFKDTSVWVSMGDGTYKHLSGEKGLVTTHDRLDGYVHKVYVV